MKRWVLMPFILVCVALAAALALWARSLHRQLGLLGRDATELGDRARQGELLAGFLDQLRRQSDSMVGNGLPLPAHGPLSSDRLPQLEDVFRGPAAVAGVELSQLKIDVESLSGEYRQLQVEVAVSGSQSTVRAYLLEICRVPCLLRLESVSLKRVDESHLQMVLGIVLDLA